MTTRTIQVRGQAHPTAHDAISLGGRYLTVTGAEMGRLQAAGVQPTTWHHHRPSGRILSVPGNVD
jgi:hypothetical protein